MKKIILLLSIFLSAFHCYSSSFKITPIILNFKGVVVQNNLTIAYADFGSAIISRDGENSWEQKRIFDGGDIINMFIGDKNIIAFNNRGEIATSGDEGKSWSVLKKLEDSALAVIQYTDGFFIRMRNKMITTDKNFEKTNEIPIESKVLKRIGIYYTPVYDKSLLFADNKLIAEIDSAVFIRFDLNLSPIDTLDLLQKVNLGNYRAGYRSFYESNYIYMKYAYSEEGRLSAVVFRTEDFEVVEKFAELKSADDYYTIANGQSYSCSNNIDFSLSDTTKFSSREINTFFRESTVANGKQYIVGDRKLFEIMDLTDSSLNVVSDYTDFSLRIPPEFLEEDTYLFYSSGIAPIYKTSDKGITLTPTIDKTAPSYSQDFKLYTFYNNYYDKENNTLLLFGDPYRTNQGVIWSSQDGGITFDSVFIDKIRYTKPIYLKNASGVRSNVQKRDDTFVLSSGWWYTPWKTLYADIETFNEDGKTIKSILDSNLTFNYIYSKDTNSYLVHSCDAIEGNSQILFTDNAGDSWGIIHKYPINETIGDVYDLEISNKKYLAFTHYDYTNYPILNGLYLDVVDKETLEYSRLAGWGSTDDPDYGMYGLAVDSDGEKAYISFQDTLFVTDDIFKKRNWSYYLLPESGRIARPLKKFNNKFFCIYTDNNNPYGKSMHWLEPQDTLITDVVVKDIGVSEYLYAYPLYPNPASTMVRAHIFWYSSIDNNLINVRIFNSLGIEVTNEKMLSLEQITDCSGYLFWDCSNLMTGVYIMQISTATKSIVRKVVVAR